MRLMTFTEIGKRTTPTIQSGETCTSAGLILAKCLLVQGRLHCMGPTISSRFTAEESDRRFTFGERPAQAGLSCLQGSFCLEEQEIAALLGIGILGKRVRRWVN